MSLFFRSSSSSSGAVDGDLRRAREISRQRQAQRGKSGTQVTDHSNDASGPGTAGTQECQSPSSSDFEMIFEGDSDSEKGTTAAPPLAPPPLSVPTHAPREPSGLSRSLYTRHTRDQASRDTSRVRNDTDRLGRAAISSGDPAGDGDDECSAVEDDDSHGRGRGRTRRREEDPALRKSMLEDALRSSLATLLSLSAPHQSQSPAMSSANLAALFASASQPMQTGYTSPLRSNEATRSFPRMSPFAFALTDHEPPPEAVADAVPALAEDHVELSEDAIEFYSETGAASSPSSDDEGTQLAPRNQASSGNVGASTGRSRAIPITATDSRKTTRGRSLSDSLPEPPAFSPIQSRPLTLGPSSASPPVWSRRRRHHRGARRSSNSPGPSPATLDERRQARNRGTTDAEESGVEPDTVFLELVGAAKAFQDMAPRLSGSGAAVSSTTASTSGQSALQGKSTVFTASQLADSYSQHRPSAWTPIDLDKGGRLSPTESLPSSDPALASSVPTIELSSDPDEVDAKAAHSSAKETTSASSAAEGQSRNGAGWFSWLIRTVEIKTWQLLGICGLLVGVGVSVGVSIGPSAISNSSLLKHTVKGSSRLIALAGTW